MSETSSSSKKKINCDQDWSDMSFMKGGRFCENCRKKVHDFTQYSNQELDDFLSKNSTVCGRFRVEQIDRDLIAPVQFPYKLKILTWAAGLFFSLESSDSLGQGQDSVKTELNTLIKYSKPDTIQTPQTNTAALPKVEKSKPKKRHKARRRKRIYLSRRFPFLRIQSSRHLMGFW